MDNELVIHDCDFEEDNIVIRSDEYTLSILATDNTDQTLIILNKDGITNLYQYLGEWLANYDGSDK
jgi:hypothetical protein